jgi:hypothetical protein
MTHFNRCTLVLVTKRNAWARELRRTCTEVSRARQRAMLSHPSNGRGVGR